MQNYKVQNLSVTARILVNAEALNMAESVGNYTRHRKAPVVVPGEDGYSIIYVPAVSGESLAHAYQSILTQIATQRGLPVTEMDRQGYYMKFSDENIIKSYYANELMKALNAKEAKEVLNELNKKSQADIERLVLLSSVVADVGGFLYTDKLVKKTSAIRFAYLTPAIDALNTRGASIVPQLHVRYTPEAKRGEQAIFYVESGSALYTLTAQLLLSDIGRITMDPNLSDDELNKQRGSRIEAAVDALMFLVDGMLFGAKRSRYLPQWDMRSLLVGVSSGPVEFNVTPGLSKDYIKRSYDRAFTLSKALNGSMKIDLFAFNGEKGYLEEPQRAAESTGVSYSEASSSAEAFSKAKEVIKSFLKGSEKG